MEDNITTTPFHEIPDDRVWELPVVYVIGILGILGNGTVFFVFVTNPKTLTKLSNLYILHQTVIDFCSSVVFLAYRTHLYYQDRGYLAGTSLLDVVTCKLWYSGYVLWAMLLTSNLNLTLLSLERHFAICHYVIHRNKYTAKRVKMSMGAIWIIGVSYQVYMTIVFDINKYGFCTPQWSSKLTQSIMGVVTFLVEYLIPLTIMTYSYITIIIQLKSLSVSHIRRKRQTGIVRAVDNDPTITTKPQCRSQSQSTESSIASSSVKPRSHSFGQSVADKIRSLSSATTSAGSSPGRASNQSLTNTLTPIQQSSSGTNDNENDNLPPVRPTRSPTLVMFYKAKHNATRTLCFVFITFVICWTPAEVEHLIDNFRTENQNCFVNCESIVDAVVTNMLLFNMIVNPIIYALSLKEFQENLKKSLLSLLKSRSSMTRPCKLLARRRTSFTPQQQGHDNVTCNENEQRTVTLLHHQTLQYRET